MTLRNLFKNNEMFESLLSGPSLNSIVLKDIDLKDGPTWNDRVKRAHKIREAFKESLSDLQDRNMEAFFLYKETLLKFILEELRKSLNQSIQVEDDEFVLDGVNMELFGLEYEKLIVKIKNFKA